MNTIGRGFTFILLLLAFQNADSQVVNDKQYVAHFCSTDQSVYRDANDRLVMNYTIIGPQTEQEMEVIRNLYIAYDVFESIEFSWMNGHNGLIVIALTKVGVTIRQQRKLFVSAGIQTVFIDGNPYPAADFKMQMFYSNQ